MSQGKVRCHHYHHITKMFVFFNLSLVIKNKTVRCLVSYDSKVEKNYDYMDEIQHNFLLEIYVIRKISWLNYARVVSILYTEAV